MTKKQPIKNQGGRPKAVLTDKQLKELQDISRNMTISQIADYFGMGERTFYEIKAQNPAVAAAYKKGKATGIKDATGLLWTKMREGDTTAIIFYLKTQAGWSTEVKNDNKLKLKFPDSKTPSDILDTALSVLENGEITLNEAQRIADLAMVKLNITTKTDITQQTVIERESEEQLIDKIYTIRKVLEHQEKQNKGN